MTLIAGFDKAQEIVDSASKIATKLSQDLRDMNTSASECLTFTLHDEYATKDPLYANIKVEINMGTRTMCIMSTDKPTLQEAGSIEFIIQDHKWVVALTTPNIPQDLATTLQDLVTQYCYDDTVKVSE